MTIDMDSYEVHTKLNKINNTLREISDRLYWIMLIMVGAIAYNEKPWIWVENLFTISYHWLSKILGFN